MHLSVSSTKNQKPASAAGLSQAQGFVWRVGFYFIQEKVGGSGGVGEHQCLRVLAASVPLCSSVFSPLRWIQPLHTEVVLLHLISLVVLWWDLPQVTGDTYVGDNLSFVMSHLEVSHVYEGFGPYCLSYCKYCASVVNVDSNALISSFVWDEKTSKHIIDDYQEAACFWWSFFHHCVANESRANDKKAKILYTAP